MMNKDSIRDLFKNLKGDFDNNIPNAGHENRFLEKLKQQNNTVANKKLKKINYWKPFLAVAASIILCFSIFTMMQQQEPEVMDLASVSPELSQAQSFFTTAIAQEIASIEAQRSPETEDMIDDTMKSLKLLEIEYQTLKIHLKESGSDKRVIYAMISNFQNRIDILKTVLEYIEDVKNFKLNQNENSI